MPRWREQAGGVTRAGQEGAVGQHKEAVGHVQAGGGDCGQGFEGG